MEQRDEAGIMTVNEGDDGGLAGEAVRAQGGVLDDGLRRDEAGRVLCQFPGCPRHPRVRPADQPGPDYSYCENAKHNPGTKYREERRLARLAAGEAPVEMSDEGLLVTGALHSAPQLITEARRLQDRQEQISEKLGETIRTVTDPSAATAEVAVVRADAAQKIADAQKVAADAIEGQRQAEASLASAQQAADFALAQMEEAQAVAAAADTRAGEAEAFAAQAGSACDAAQAAADTLRGDLIRANERLADTERALDEARTQAAAQIDRLTTALSAAQSDLAAQTALRQAAETARDTAQAAKDEVTAELGTARTGLATQTALREQTERHLAEQRAETTTERTAAEDLRRQLTEARTQLTAAATAATEADRQRGQAVNDLESVRADLGRQICDLRDQARQAGDRATAERTERAETAQELTRLRADLDALRDQQAGKSGKPKT
jgi:chromosome segregation ATPase